MIFYLSLLCLIIGFFYEVYLFFAKRENQLIKEKDIKKNPDIAILIPARNESRVIENLLESIEKQTVMIPSSNVYIIVESEKDPTIPIVKRHNMNYFVRKKLNLKTKGYALCELIEDLEAQKKYYDCYFIFDADNVLEKNFISYMLEDYKKGYSVSTGYRALKNTDHYFPVSAGLTYSMINEIRNRNVLKYNGTLILSGTGYYIHGRLIKEWGTFPFHSLTEDYESSLYYALHGISTHYQNKAIFYDEQPETYQKSIIQRSRWIKGYLTNWLHYRKQLKRKLKDNPTNPGSLKEMNIGIIPALWIVLGLVILIVNALFNIGFYFSLQLLLYLGLLLIFIYFILLLFTALLLFLVKKQMPLSISVTIKTLLYHPIFLISYLHAFMIAITKKNLGWEVVKHGKE